MSFLSFYVPCVNDKSLSNCHTYLGSKSVLSICVTKQKEIYNNAKCNVFDII